MAVASYFGLYEKWDVSISPSLSVSFQVYLIVNLQIIFIQFTIFAIDKNNLMELKILVIGEAKTNWPD